MKRQRAWLQTLTVPLLNVAVNHDFAVTSNDAYELSIVSISDAQRKRWAAAPRVQFSIEGAAWMLPRARSAAEIKTLFNAPILNRADANEDLTALLNLLGARLPYPLWTPFGECVRIGQSEECGIILTFSESRLPSEMEYHATLKVSEIRVFRRYWRTVTGLSPQNERMRRAISRLARARASFFAEDAIVHAFIGLESMLGDQTKEAGKTAKKVTRRLSRFVLDPELSPTIEDLTRLSDRIRELYDLRHAILHGGLPNESETNQAAKDAIELLRAAILIVFEEGFARLKDLAGLAAQYDKDLQVATRAEKRWKQARGVGTGRQRWSQFSKGMHDS